MTRILAVLLLISCMQSTLAVAHLDRDVTAAVSAFCTLLNAEEKQKVMLPFDDAARTGDWCV